jgi:hypothetical protein
MTEALALQLVPEVGFEALLPAYLGWVEAKLGAPDAARPHFARADELVGGVDNPTLRAVSETLRAAAFEEPLPPLEEAWVASSSDLRRIRRLSASDQPAAIRVSDDGRALHLADGTAVDLTRRAAPRRLLVELARARIEEPGRVRTFEELIEAGWPGERMHPEAARKRLRTAIWTLRKMGLESVIVTHDDGYSLDREAHVVWRE